MVQPTDGYCLEAAGTRLMGNVRRDGSSSASIRHGRRYRSGPAAPIERVSQSDGVTAASIGRERRGVLKTELRL
eukprot:4675986-Prymnesium_polylepis.1